MVSISTRLGRGFFAVATSLLLSGGAARADAASPDYSAFGQGVFLRYLNAEAGQLRQTPRIGLSFGDRVLHAVLDSGSTGVVVAASFLPNFDQLPSVGDGRLTYTSSGRVMLGRWVVTPLTLVGRDGASVTTEPMPVLGVTRVACLERARDCTPNDAPRDIAMIGVGFAREHDAQAQSTPEKNPLLRVAAGGSQRHGFILTPEGVHAGLTRENTKGAFRFVKLERQVDLPDWSAVPACIMLGGGAPACGTMLVDTGVAAMFMTVPPQAADAPEGTVAAGTSVSIRLGTAEANSELYAFTAGERTSPLAPETIHLNVSDRQPFVNTSFHLLNGFDFLYDADGGYAGFRPR